MHSFSGSFYFCGELYSYGTLLVLQHLVVRYVYALFGRFLGGTDHTLFFISPRTQPKIYFKDSLKCFFSRIFVGNV
jgi:hypothetical protein